MASRVVLSDFSNGSLQLTAGTIIDDTRPDMAALRAAGLIDAPAAPSPVLTPIVAAAVQRYLGLRASGVPQREDDLLPMLLRTIAGASMILTANGQNIEQRLVGGGGAGNGGFGSSIYVDLIKGDDNTGQRGNDNFPFLTIQAAVNAAVSGDIVELCGGAFVEAVTIPGGLAILGINGQGRQTSWTSPLGVAGCVATNTSLVFQNMSCFGDGAPFVVTTGTGLGTEGTLFINSELSADTGATTAIIATGLNVIYLGTSLASCSLLHIDCPVVFISNTSGIDSVPEFKVSALGAQTFFLASGITPKLVLEGDITARFLSNTDLSDVTTQSLAATAFLQFAGCTVNGDVVFEAEGSLAFRGVTFNGNFRIMDAVIPFSVDALGSTLLGNVVIGANVTLALALATFAPAAVSGAGDYTTNKTAGSLIAITGALQSITFPGALGSASYSLQITCSDETSSGSPVISNRSTTGFDIQYGSAAGTFDYVAVTV